MIDCPGTQDGSSLRSLIDKSPVCGNSFSPLTGALLTGFRLHTGPVLTEYNLLTSPKVAHVFSMLICCDLLIMFHPVQIQMLIFMGFFKIIFIFFPAPRTVQTDAHTASKKEKQTQAQTPSTTRPITTRYGIRNSYIYSAQMYNVFSG